MGYQFQSIGSVGPVLVEHLAIDFAMLGTLIGLYEFENTPDDIAWLETMGKIATVSHSPFLSPLPFSPPPPTPAPSSTGQPLIRTASRSRMW